MGVYLFVTIVIKTVISQREIDNILAENDIEYDWDSDGSLCVYDEDADTVIDLLSERYIDAQKCA